MKLDKHREQYFSDLSVKTTLNKRGRKTYAYVYQGIWYRWGLEGFDVKKRRLLYVLLEIANIALFAYAGFSASTLNFQKFLAGCGLLSIVPFLMELRGVFGFCFSEVYMMETDYKSIDFRLVYGGLIRVLILLVGLGTGLISAISQGNMDAYSILTAIAYAGTIVLSALISRLHHKLGYRNYKSIDGEVGPEC